MTVGDLFFIAMHKKLLMIWSNASLNWKQSVTGFVNAARENKAMMDKEEILQWAKMVGEYRLPDIIERFERYKKTISEKKREALEERAN